MVAKVATNNNTISKVVETNMEEVSKNKDFINDFWDNDTNSKGGCV